MKDVRNKAYQEQVFQLLLEADDEGLNTGEDPKQRAFMNPMRVMKKLGVEGFVMAGPGRPAEIDLVHELQKRIYRQEDIGMGALHHGAFMFRDLFARFHIPIMYGQSAIEPLKCIDFLPSQIWWMCRSEAHVARYEDQYFDVLDFAYGIMEMPPSKAPERARELFRLAQFQIEAAAGSLCRQYGYVGATQAGLLSIELASKAALVSAGTDEETLKDKFGHNLLKLAKEVGRVHPAFDVERVTRSLGTMPSYVPNRYSGDQPGRMESGHIVMRAQYIVSEIVRQFGARNFRNECGFDKARSYPE